MHMAKKVRKWGVSRMAGNFPAKLQKTAWARERTGPSAAQNHGRSKSQNRGRRFEKARERSTAKQTRMAGETSWGDTRGSERRGKKRSGRMAGILRVRKRGKRRNAQLDGENLHVVTHVA